jgi:hypothetical protein
MTVENVKTKSGIMTPDWLLQVAMLAVSVIFGSAVWYFYDHKQFLVAVWVGFAGGVLFLLAVALYLRNDIIRREVASRTPVYFGELVPGNDPSPPLPPGVPNNTIQLWLGDDLRVLAANAQNFVFSKAGRSFLSVGITNGLMRINATVMDSNNRHIIRIIENEFQASPEYSFNPRQPDEHSLVVRDADGNEVLNIRFLNPRAMRIVGRFHIPGLSEPVLILPSEGIRWPGGGGIGHLTVDLTASQAGFIGFP